MRLPQLREILVEGARRQEQTGAKRLWLRVRHRPALVALVVGAACASAAAAAAVTLTLSRPLSGTLPRSPIVGASGPSRYVVKVFPMMAVGWSGWCTSLVFAGRGNESGASLYGCGPTEDGDSPVVAGGLQAGDPNGAFTWAVVSDRVASVRVDPGQTLVPLSDPRLPRGTRAFVEFTPPHPGHGTGTPAPGELEFLDGAGRVIPDTDPGRDGAVRRFARHVIAVDAVPELPCAIHMRPSAGDRMVNQTLVSSQPWPRRQSGSFLACSNATLRVGAATLMAAVLVNATNPRRAAPGLPDLHTDHADPRLLSGHDLGSAGLPGGVSVANLSGHVGPVPFEEPARTQPLADTDVSARRAGRAWLVAEGGSDRQRAQLLALLSVSGLGAGGG